jgi:hypothetical protein
LFTFAIITIRIALVANPLQLSDVPYLTEVAPLTPRNYREVSLPKYLSIRFRLIFSSPTLQCFRATAELKNNYNIWTVMIHLCLITSKVHKPNTVITRKLWLTEVKASVALQLRRFVSIFMTELV